MTRSFRGCAALLTAAGCLLGTVPARADLMQYLVMSKGGRPLTFQGRITVNAGMARTLSFRHPKFGNLTFAQSEVRWKILPTMSEQFDKLLVKAQQKKDAEAVFEAAVWALKHGLIRDYYEGVDATLKLNPKHELALKVQEVRQKIAEPAPNYEKQEKFLKGFVKKAGMKIAKSDHYILMYDTPDKPEEGRKEPRHTERLALLEQVYASFLLTFYSRGVTLEIPKDKLMVVLFNDYQEYLRFSTGLEPSLASAAGYWEPERNVAVFYDHGSDDEFKKLQALSDQLQARKAQAQKSGGPGARELVRDADAIRLMLQIQQENEDIEVVSHECTHQMAGNTGLFPRLVRVPSWMHEGLATYFECPDDASWSGIGAVNATRLTWYRGLERDREHSNIEFIVTDQVFDLAASHGAKLHAYGQAWALTHFLIERHLEKFIEYYRLVGEMPRDVPLGPEVLSKLFTRVFGEDRQGLDTEWRAYMAGLKTDTEKIWGE